MKACATDPASCISVCLAWHQVMRVAGRLVLVSTMRALLEPQCDGHPVRQEGVVVGGSADAWHLTLITGRSLGARHLRRRCFVRSPHVCGEPRWSVPATWQRRRPVAGEWGRRTCGMRVVLWLPRLTWMLLGVDRWSEWHHCSCSWASATGRTTRMQQGAYSL